MPLQKKNTNPSSPTIQPPTSQTTLPTSSSDEDLMAGLLGDVLSHKNTAGSGFDTAKANYLNYLLTQNQRQYDEEWRDNEREYTSASSQLQRLMATGMSYSAAMAALNGSGDAGSSSGITQMTANQQDTSKDFDTAFGFANTLFNTVYGGVNLAQNVKLSRSQIGMLSSQTTSNNLQSELLRRQLGAYDAADGVGATINYAIDSGAWQPNDEDRATSSTLLKAALKAGVINEQQLSDVHSSSFARMAFDELFNSNWSTQGVKMDDALYTQTAAAQFASAQVQQMSPSVTQQQLDNMYAVYENLVAENESIKAGIANTRADTNYKNSLTVGQQLENTIKRPTAEAYRQYAAKVTQTGKYMISYKMAEWAAYSGNTRLLQKRINYDFETGAISSEVAKQWITYDKWCTDAAAGKFGVLSSSELAEVALYLHNLQPYVQDNLRKVKSDQGVHVPWVYDDKVQEEFNVFEFGKPNSKNPYQIQKDYLEEKEDPLRHIF